MKMNKKKQQKNRIVLEEKEAIDLYAQDDALGHRAAQVSCSGESGRASHLLFLSTFEEFRLNYKQSLLHQTSRAARQNEEPNNKSSIRVPFQ